MWSTRTRIMEGMEEFVFQEETKPSKGAPENTYDIKFRSAYWVALLTRYDVLRRSKPKDVSTYISEHLRSITAVQEILVTPDLNPYFEGHRTIYHATSTLKSFPSLNHGSRTQPRIR